MSLHMSTNMITPEIAAIEAQAVADGFMDADGFFTQSDAEFELDTLQPGARKELEALLARPGFDPETVAFLRDSMVQSREVHFEPFQD